MSHNSLVYFSGARDGIVAQKGLSFSLRARLTKGVRFLRPTFKLVSKCF